jgi:hypothetical protein
MLAKTQYLTLTQQGASSATVARARFAWRQFEARKAAIIARMVALEELEDGAIA